MNQPFGPRTNRVYEALRNQIQRGSLAPGQKLPRYLDLAAEFGVAPMTVRQVLGRLEQEGLVLRRPGRGTFVCEPTESTVLIVVDEPARRAVFSDRIERAGYRVVAVGAAVDALTVLERDITVALVLSAVCLPDASTGSAFIQSVRRRRPELPLAAVIASLDDLTDLYGTPEWPLLILPRCPRAGLIEALLHLVLAR